jgi:competence protein ComEC
VRKPAAAVLAWSLLGYGAAGWRTHEVDAPIMPDTERGWTVEGWVRQLDSGDRIAVTIDVSRIDGMTPEETPARVRVRVTGEPPSLGEGVRVRAGLAPPPGPSAPDDYDFSRQAYFDRIGGTGFSYGAAEPMEIETRGIERIERGLSRVRGAITDHISAHVQDGRGAVLAALVTGVRGGVNEEDTEALRDSGLYHLLSISGSHMSLVGGGMFALACFLLALIAPLSRSYDVRKPAAAVGLFASTAYLLLSGGNVTAQRAYIMLAVMFVALLFDRRALTMRNIAVAAVIVLLTAPESLFEAGFQMSFAATIAMIAAYEAFSERRMVGVREFSVWAGALRFFGALVLTSLIAGAATGFFAAFHFNRTAPYSLLGNLLGMPLFTFWVMPLITLGTVLSPFGADAMFWRAAAWGMGAILRIGDWVASWPGAMVPIRAGAPAALLIYSSGFVVLCAGRGAARAAGLAIMGAACLVWMASPRPILWVSDTAVIAGEMGGILYASDIRRSEYGVDQFGQRQGMGEGAPVTHLREIAACDSEGCLGRLNGLRIAAPVTRGAAVTDCADADLVAFREPVSARLRRTCRGIMLDGGVLTARGPAVIMRAKDGALSVRHAGETAWRSPYRESVSRISAAD